MGLTCTFTGTIVGANGTVLAGVPVEFLLCGPGGTSYTTSHNLVERGLITAVSNGSGVISQVVARNDELTPALTFWRVECKAAGLKKFIYSNGDTIDVIAATDLGASSQIFAGLGDTPDAIWLSHDHVQTLTDAQKLQGITNLGLNIDASAGVKVLGRSTASNGVPQVLSTSGTGNVVMTNTPTLVTPILGTPSSGTLTNCTGLPVSGITASTTTAIGVGSIELGHATANTLTASSGVLSIEGKTVLDQTNTLAGITNKTFVAPVLGAATATSINGITISAGGSGTLTMEGSINTSANGGSIDTAGHSTGLPGGSITTKSVSGWYPGGFINTSSDEGQGGYIDTRGPYEGGSGGNIDTSGDVANGGSINTSGSGTFGGNGGSINTSGGGASPGGNIDTREGGGSINTGFNGGYISTTGGGYIDTTYGGNINTSGGGGSINTTGTGSIELGVTGTRTTFTGAASGTNKSIALPNLSGTVVVTAATSATATQALFATATTGAPAYRAIASADIATALTTPGPIGTTPNTGAFTTLTGTSSATLGVNGGTGGSVVLRGSTSGSATINTSVTGVLALPSGTTATSMALTTPVLGTPSSGTLTSCTGLPVATGISGLGTGVATALALATNAVGGIATKKRTYISASDILLYNSGGFPSFTALGSTFQGAYMPNAADTTFQILLDPAEWAGRSAKVTVVFVGSASSTDNVNFDVGLDWKTTAIDGATNSMAGPGWGAGGGSPVQNLNQAGPATQPYPQKFTSQQWNITAGATFLSLWLKRNGIADAYAGNIAVLWISIDEQ